MEQVERLVEEIQQIKAQYRAEVAGHRKQWPRAIRERVMSMVNGGLKMRDIAERTGISYHTIASWREQKKSKFHQLPVVTSKLPKAISTVAKNSAIVTVTKNSTTVTVKTPDGFVVQVRDLGDAVFLIARLRRGR